MKKGWFKGAVWGLIVGISFGALAFLCSLGGPTSSCEIFTLVPSLMWRLVKSNDYLYSIVGPSDFLELFVIALPYVLVGSLIGWSNEKHNNEVKLK